MSGEIKVKEVTSGGAVAAYRAVMYGDMPAWKAVWAEILTSCIGWLPGALGLFLRMKLYPTLFRRCGRKVVFGRNILLRHPHKIELGDGVVLDDGCTVDAKGGSNRGIRLGDKVYVGRGTTLYCKNGDIDVLVIESTYGNRLHANVANARADLRDAVSRLESFLAA